VNEPRGSGVGRERVPPPVQRHASGYVWFLESLDAVHRAIQGTSDLGEALDAALGVVLEVLGGDRAWLLEAHAETWTPMMERTRPEYPGGLALGMRQPFTAETAAMHDRVHAADWCVQFDPEHIASLAFPEDVEPPRGVLAIAIHSKVGTSWIFGMHQCSYARTWSPEEERLFVEIGHRLADALTSLIAYRDVRDSAEKLAQAGRVARLGYWERDVATFEVAYSEGTYEIFGLTPGVHTLAPAKLAERLHPEDRHIMVEAYERAIAGGPRYDVDYRVLHPDGAIRYVHSEADVTWSADGRALRMFGVLQDITERKQVEERLIRYRDSLERLAREQEALRRVATLVARATSPEEIFASVTEEVARLLTVDLAVLARYDAGTETIVAGWTASGDLEGIGTATALGGRNVSTIVYDTRRPVRIENYAEATGEIAGVRRAWGVRAIVGVPIIVEGEVRGVMAVASTTDRPLPHDAEERLASFTELLATAYANAEAREALRRVADEQAALRRVATRVARGEPAEEVFAAVAEEVGMLLPTTELALVGRYMPDHSIQYVGAWSAFGETEWLGKRVRLGGHNVSTVIFETGQPGRVDQLDEEATEVTALAREQGARSSAGAPIEVEGRLWGVMIVASVHEAVLPPQIEHELAAFTELIATAIGNAEARAELTASRARIVTSADETRRQIVRDLHDGAQSRLVQTMITLDLTRHAQEQGDVAQAQQLLDEALDHAKGANGELRDLVQGILPSGLARWGLASAVSELIDRLRVPVTADVAPDRFRPEIERNAYFVIAEALTNVVKHSGARRATVRVWVEDGLVQVEVRDDGVGGARPEGSGLRGLADRIDALGGALAIDSPRAGGTRITARLPP
jgi:PAS domain S-box-containing protein